MSRVNCFSMRDKNEAGDRIILPPATNDLRQLRER